MSQIKNPNAYRILPSVNVIEPGKDFRVTFIGLYDPDFGIESDPTYKSGALKDDNGKLIYDDTHLNGNNCAYLYLKHRWLGVSYFAKKMSRGHFHIKCIVSNNAVNLWDCSYTSKSGDIYFFADIVDDMPIVLYNNTYSLFVIEPRLTQSEISALAFNVKKVFQWKERMIKSSKQVAVAHANEVLAVSMMSEAVVKAAIYAEHINTLSKMLNIAQDKLLESTGRSFDMISGAIDSVEEKFDVGILSGETMSKGISSLLKRQNVELKYIESMTKLDSDSDVMKRQVFNTALQFIGIEKMREFMKTMIGDNVKSVNVPPSMAVLSALENFDLDRLDAKEKAGIMNRLVNYIKGDRLSNGESDKNLEEDINNAITERLIKLEEEGVPLPEAVDKA